MPETVILNPTTVWDEEIQDCMMPDYGFTVDRPQTRAVVKPAGGRPYSRETANTGHTFQLSWLNRSFKCVQRLKRFFEQYEDGFFTIIDWDGGGRHYVGRFTGNFPRVQLGNDRYQVQGLTFEEIPGVPMLEYPSDWDNDSVLLKPLNDFGDIQVGILGAWAQQIQTDPETGATNEWLLSNGTAGDMVAVEYRGYGCRLYMGLGPNAGTVEVFFDGVSQGIIDLYQPVDEILQVVLELGQVSLDFHRVKVVTTGNNNVASGGATAKYGYLEVMR